MSGAITATRLGDIAEGTQVLRIYLDYGRLRLSTLRNLLSDVEASYNRIERHLNQLASERERGADSPLLVERIDTGHSVVHIFTGSPEAFKVFGLLLAAIHFAWSEIGVGETVSVVGGVGALFEFRNRWLKGTKTRAEVKKIAAETDEARAGEKKTIAETSKIILETTELRHKLAVADPSQAAWHSFVVTPQSSEPEALVEGFGARLRVLARSSDVKRLEITAGGKKLTLLEDGTIILSDVE